MRRYTALVLTTALAAGCSGGSPKGSGGSTSSSTGTGGTAGTGGSASSTSSSSTSSSSPTGSTTSGNSDGGTMIAHEWDTAGSYGGPGFGTFTCTFTVPDTPAYTQQSVFLWCGVQQASGVTPTGDTSFGVLQPVLMFGGDCIQELPEGAGFGPGNDSTYDAHPYWYYSSQYVYPSPSGSTSYQCTSGPVFKASPGDVLVSTFTMTASGATVAMAQQNGTGQSSLTAASPWDQSGQSWSQFLGSSNQIIVEAAVEVWDLDSPSGWPKAFQSGWSVSASITPATGLTTNQWQLAPWNNGTLKVACSHDAATYGSTCTWTE